jgi:hypothetical protein
MQNKIRMARRFRHTKKNLKKKKKKSHRHLAVKFETTPQKFSPPKLQLSLGLSLRKYYTHQGK